MSRKKTRLDSFDDFGGGFPQDESDEPIHIESKQSSKAENSSKQSHTPKTALGIRIAKDSSSEKSILIDMFEGDDFESIVYEERYYSMYPSENSTGVFGLLDDFFTERLKFFYSSKTVQSFIMAIVKAERDFHKKTGFKLFDYCAKVTKTTLEKAIDTDGFGDDGDTNKLSVGYGIVDECRLFNKIKKSTMNKKLMRELADNIFKYFKEFLDYAENKHFTGLVASTLDEIPPSFCQDPFIDLPMIIYIPEFAKLLMTKVSYGMLSQEVFVKNDIDTVHIDIYLAMPNMTLGDLKNMMIEDNEIKNFERIEDNKFIIGKYESYDIVLSEINEKKFDSIIAY